MSEHAPKDRGLPMKDRWAFVRWSTCFQKYLKRSGKTRLQAAFELGVAYATVHYWIKQTMIPSAHNQKRVEKWSKGFVRTMQGVGSLRVWGATGTDP